MSATIRGGSARNYGGNAKKKLLGGMSLNGQVGGITPEEYAEIIAREFRHGLGVGVNKGTAGMPAGLFSMLKDILLQVQRPARYIAQEWNVSRKDFTWAKIKFALCFPDLYEVGMSNLGVRIIYGILNGVADVCCERFFAPDADMENILRGRKEQIFSLESRRKLSDFDFLGFSLGYELNYTNALNMLDLGKIPLSSALRDHRHPIVIAGGPCAINPEPMHDFFDFFIIGEGEEVILEIIDVYRKFQQIFKTAQLTRHELLIAFSQIVGVYVPSLYEVHYNPDGSIKAFFPKAKDFPVRIQKRFIRDLNQAYFPLDWLVPYIPIVHDRITLEVMRGCPHQCYFCQAKPQYYPFRYRSRQRLLSLAEEIYRRSGYEEISLCGLSVSDYPGIKELSQALTEKFKAQAVGISLPSIKPHLLVADLSSLCALIRKTGLTFAPEAATPRLRRILNKDFNTEDFFQVVSRAYQVGYQHIKLYFMIGIPYENEADLDQLVEFVCQVSELKRKILLPSLRKNKVGSSCARVNVSINTLIPKPHTPFQWLGMETTKGIKEKQDYLARRLKGRRLIHLSMRNPKMSFLEAVLARGDRRLSAVIWEAFSSGARFDAWENHFSFTIWQEAFQKNRLDPNFYLSQKSPQEILPWGFLDVGLDTESLLCDFRKITNMC